MVFNLINTGIATIQNSPIYKVPHVRQRRWNPTLLAWVPLVELRHWWDGAMAAKRASIPILLTCSKSGFGRHLSNAYIQRLVVKDLGLDDVRCNHKPNIACSSGHSFKLLYHCALLHAHALFMRNWKNRQETFAVHISSCQLRFQKKRLSHRAVAHQSKRIFVVCLIYTPCLRHTGHVLRRRGVFCEERLVNFEDRLLHL